MNELEVEGLNELEGEGLKVELEVKVNSKKRSGKRGRDLLCDLNGVDEPAVQVIGQLDDSCGDLIKVNLLLTTITLQNEHLESSSGRKSN